jgi:multiple sugar transport system substrate-binding protein
MSADTSQDKTYSRRDFVKAAGGVAGGIAAGTIAAGALASLGTPRASAAPVHVVARKRKFEGITLKIASLAGGPVGEPNKILGKPWEQATGAKIQVIEYPIGDLFNKIRSALVVGEYIGDLFDIASLWGGDLMGGGYCEPVPAAVKAKLNLPDVLPALRHYLSWGGIQYGVPMDGDYTFLNYRKDLLGNPQYQATFKSQMGYAMPVPPRTWKEYLDVAKFFQGLGLKQNGQRVYGEILNMAHKSAGFWIYLSHAAAYSKYPGDPAFFFDPDTMEPLIPNPGFVRALQEWKLEGTKYGPPGMITYGQGDERGGMVAGRAALNYEWADMGTLSYGPGSVIDHKLGFALMPGSHEVYNRKTKSWHTFKQVSYAPYLAFGGWIQVVPKNSQQKEAAWDFATFMGTQPRETQNCVLAGSGVNPNRFSVLNDVQAWIKAGFDRTSAMNYLEVIKETVNHPNHIIDMRIPGQADYQDALEVATAAALAGQMTPQQALQQAATQWDAITDRLGRAKQKLLYKQSLQGA